MSEISLTDPYEIARYIKEAKKSTPVKVYVKGDLEGVEFPNCRVFGEGRSLVVFGEYTEIQSVLAENKGRIEYYEIENGLARLRDIIYDICTVKINKMTVDTVLHQYTLCNMAYDTLTRKLKEFSDKYNAEQRKLEVSQRVKDTASKLARGNKLLGQKRPTTK